MTKGNMYPGYSDPETEAIQQHKLRLDELQELWDSALLDVANAYGFDVDADPSTILQSMEQETNKRWLAAREQNPDSPVVVGIAGPGASGKGTIGSFLNSKLGYVRAINTTTRSPRHYEVDGEDYYFVTEEEFRRQEADGEFLQSNLKPGRGLYGIQRREVEQKLAQSKGIGCILEESPINLVRSFSSGSMGSMDSKPLLALLYILPPHPIMYTSAKRLYDRSAVQPELKQLTEVDVNSTLGERQSSEFRDLITLRDDPHTQLVIMVNDQLEESRKKASRLFGHIFD